MDDEVDNYLMDGDYGWQRFAANDPDMAFMRPNAQVAEPPVDRSYSAPAIGPYQRWAPSPFPKPPSDDYRPETLNEFAERNQMRYDLNPERYQRRLPSMIKHMNPFTNEFDRIEF